MCSSPGGVLRALRLCVPALRRRGWSLCPRLAACFLVGADFGVSVGYVLSFDFLRAFYHELYYARVGRLSVLLNLAVGSVLFGSVLSLFDAVVDHCLFGSLLATWLTPTSVSPGTTCCPSTSFRKPSTTSSTTRRCVASCCASPSVVCPVLFGVVLQLYDAVFGHCVVVRCVLLG